MLERLHRHKAIIHEVAAKTQQPAQYAKWEWHHEMHARPAAWKWHDDLHATPQALPVNAQQTGAALSPVTVYTAAANRAGQSFTCLFKTEKQRPAPDMHEVARIAAAGCTEWHGSVWDELRPAAVEFWP